MFLRIPSQNQTTLSRGIRLIHIFDRVVQGRVIGWTMKLPIRMLGFGLPKSMIRMLGCGSPKLCSDLRKAFNSKPGNESDTAMFKSKLQLSSAENSCAARRDKHKRSQAFPASPSAITGFLPRHVTVRGRGPDVLPGTKAQIAVEYAEAGGKASGAGRSVAAKRGIHPAQPAKFHKQVQDHNMDSKRRWCGRKGLLELRPEVAELICDALVDNDKQS